MLYRILFVGVDGQEICSIHGLTEGEARWIAQSVLRYCQRWFG